MLAINCLDASGNHSLAGDHTRRIATIQMIPIVTEHKVLADFNWGCIAGQDREDRN